MLAIAISCNPVTSFGVVGPDGGWINGQVLRANGGMV
jgi:hypothetical protein